MSCYHRLPATHREPWLAKHREPVTLIALAASIALNVVVLLMNVWMNDAERRIDRLEQWERASRTTNETLLRPQE